MVDFASRLKHFGWGRLALGSVPLLQFAFPTMLALRRYPDGHKHCSLEVTGQHSAWYEWVALELYKMDFLLLILPVGVIVLLLAMIGQRY